ncbi:hypothetical protein SUGI_1178420 [Cryptomeria japonica]|uniref:uncharacterized protein LOC131049044 n=1 Tax=Cryptomeria japonica TaxID=3369 RepID=UPI002414CD0D|nr:uncharacterized protein LOC131049044 [Cryptomeria japonica]GLJ54877.1 hypothetical protein SUGI_1178420 [Cryptomeria japonica]
MGKQGKKHHDRRNGRSMRNEDDDPLPSSAYDPAISIPESSSRLEEETIKEDKYQELPLDGLSKFDLYQHSVQSPKGDISYIQKFFWTYVGGRSLLHLQEDFCGTAFLSAEWLRSDPRRTVVGVDLDVESLKWGLKHNVDKVGGDAYSRICLYHGNVLNSLSSAQLINSSLLEGENDNSLRNAEFEPSNVIEDDAVSHVKNLKLENNEKIQEYQGRKGSSWPAADVVCAFNYSCCCLKSRSDLVLYFKKALNAISNEGGIFVMDLYGGSSSEHALKFRRRYEDFTYIWEQEDFDIISRTTRISLHFNLNKMQRSYRHAFTYHWRLWTLPEIKDCLEEAGFSSVHFWIREMPDIQGEEMEDYDVNDNVKYEEVSSFKQQGAWNAYIVAVTNKVEMR